MSVSIPGKKTERTCRLADSLLRLVVTAAGEVGLRCYREWRGACPEHAFSHEEAVAAGRKGGLANQGGPNRFNSETGRAAALRGVAKGTYGLPLGTERVRVRDGKPYVYVKVARGVWLLKHRVLLDRRGLFQDRYDYVRFHDGNTLNCRLANLEPAHRSEAKSFVGER
ncbi:MAG: hypothetical protein ACYC3I_15740 [Gemmataceae bacterium]